MNEKLMFSLIDKGIHYYKETIELFRGKTLLITGGTGVVGSWLVKTILLANRVMKLNCTIILLVRDCDKAIRYFGNDKNILYCKEDILNQINIQNNVDYVIHAAAQTNSYKMVEEPVETIMTSVIGTNNILEFCKHKNVKSIIYLSSMEVYGVVKEETSIDEEFIGDINHLLVRSSYSESKRMCENICVAYCKEYSIPVKVIRLSQVIAPLNNNDKRLIGELINCISLKKNMILHSDGMSKRNYIFIVDAVFAVFQILLHGINGEVYNAANSDWYYSVKDLCERIISVSESKIELLIENKKLNIYPENSFLKLNTTKIEGLGWKPLVSFDEAIKSII